MFTELIKEDRDTAVMEFTSRLKRFSVPTVKRFSKDYFEADPEAASSWLQTLPRGLARETAAEAMRQASDEE